MILNEIALLGMLAALGATPAAALSGRFDLSARLALAPVFGFAIGVDLFTTTLWKYPGNSTFWLFPTLCGISLAGAFAISLFRKKRASENVGMRDWIASSLQWLFVSAITSLPVNWIILRANSHGPVAYQVPDAIVYVNNVDGAQVESVHSAATLGNNSDLLLSFWRSYVHAYQRLDAVPLFANANALFGEHGTQTESAFLLVLVIIGALGVFAGIRYFTSSRTWVAPIAGVLFGGPLFLQLYFDGSQAALCALILIVPIIIIAADLIRRPHPWTCVLGALLLSTLTSVYPLYLPAVGLGLASLTVLLILWRIFLRPREGIAHSFLVGFLCLVATGAMSYGFNVVGFAHAKYALQSVSSSVSGQPNYAFLVPRILPSWLFQTHGFYDLPLSSHTLIDNLLLALVVPLLLFIVVILGFRRYPMLVISIPIIGCIAAIAVYSRLQTYTGFPTGCTYCEDRNLLPIAPILVLLVGIGIASLALAKRQSIKVLSVGTVAVLVGSVGYATYREQNLFASGSYFLPNSIATVLSKLPDVSGGIQEEGFDESPPNPTAESSLVYLLIDEMYPQRASQIVDINENNSSLYYGSGTLSLSDHRFHPFYRFILTRSANVSTNRKLIAKDGSIGLYERTGPLDVLMDWGFSANYPTTSTTGLPIPTDTSGEPMRFVVAGGSPKSPPAYVRLTFQRLPGPVTITGVDGSTAYVELRPQHAFVCLTTQRPAPVRTTDLQVNPHPALILQRMTVNTTPCK